MRAATPKRAGKGIRALTLVEMIGVLAIIAIVASFVAPSLIRQVQTATAAGEDAKLDDIAQALTNAIKATGFIPNPNLDPTTTNSAQGFGWAYLASNYTRLVGSNLISVFPGLTNDTGRRLYLSTNLAGTASNGGYNRTLSNWGATFYPTNAKMYLVSASRPDFNLLLPANGPGAQGTNNTNAFPLVTALENWIKVVSNGVVAAPANLVDGWTNKGEFLHVRTIDLASIFNEARAAQQKITDQEDKNLEEIARALIAYIQARGTIPNPSTSAATGWVADISSYSSLGNQAIQYSFPASSIGERRLYLDTSLTGFIGATPVGGWVSPPSPPASAYLISSSREDNGFLNVSTANGGTAITTNALNFLRSWQKAPNPDGVIIADNTELVSSTWANRGEFLHVMSLDLRSLFCLVQIEDCRSPASVSGFFAGSGYTNTNLKMINTNGVTISVSFFGDNTNMSIGSASVASAPGKILWADTGFTNSLATSASTNITIVGAQTNGYVTLTFPATPSFSISTNTLALMATQTNSFYVFKGTLLRLGDNSLLLQKNIVVNQDVSFRFINGAWNQLY